MLKRVMGCLLVAIAVLAFQGAQAAGAGTNAVVEVATENYTMQFNDGQGVLVINGSEALQMGSVLLVQSPPYFLGVSAEKTGENTAAVTYQTYDDETGAVTLAATYTCLPNVIRIHMELTAPSSVNTGGAMLEIYRLDGTPEVVFYKSGLWTRNANGGEAYETKDGYYRYFANPSKQILMKVLGVVDWASEWYQHIPFTRVGETDTYTSDIEVFVLAHELQTFQAAAAAIAGRPGSVEISTTKDYNLFKPEDGAPQFVVTVNNAQNSELEGELTVIARTLDNERVIQSKKPIDIGAYASFEETFTLPTAERELYFVEASLAVNGTEVFSRTNVAILPDFTFQHKNESVFGISAYFPLPDNLSALKLLDRIGVHHLRNGDNREIPSDVGILAFASSDVYSPEREEADTAAKRKWIANSLNTFLAQENPIWEFGNEWNPWDETENEQAVADLYGEWAKLACQIRNRKNYPIKIISQGIAGADMTFLRCLLRNGTYARLDGIAFHPGRGNVTADAQITYWNYYGTVKKMMNFVRAHGNKPAYATEVYAGTFPNCYNSDSYRQAAADTVLSLSLGLSQGLSSIQVYQLNDGTHYDVGGLVSQENWDVEGFEYHFGLLMRDLSLKPSAMAYAVTAEMLDGATFVKYLDQETGYLHALVFDTDAGRITILWDRTKGYVQGRDREGFRHLEPWLSTYREKVKYTFNTTKNEVTVVDMIGRKHTVQATDGVVELELDGEPIFVTDLDI